ncbi:pyridoxamine 5'-phosphate oxidase family protein [Chryseolinea sp. H1M3-3]|uniref:pyridoxamine 5'-phosphate oxidase family protein n=1 Tax=Chryseolinea sp. H1M3-3 TaxID=3034144 RepID=UPI0023EB0899|nr:pyridoxamine 5'-phosphate oxidase family protein [Chryseolinea sp. H1M3-3]
MENIYHPGEILVQQKANERTIADRNGRAVTNKIIPGAINFIEKLPFAIASSRNEAGEIFVSFLSGSEGFIRVINDSHIEINVELSSSNPNDQFWRNAQLGQHIGFLFIEPLTRRRYRLNGKIDSTGKKIQIVLEQAYPNCPKYIQKRSFARVEKNIYPESIIQGRELSPELISLVKSADCIFVGSADLSGSMDASHRGGLPGFIHITNPVTLIIPDYPGNGMFNTLGNFITNPNAGILLLDHESKRTLQIIGNVQIHWQLPDLSLNTSGTNRSWSLTIHRWILMDNMFGLSSEFIEYSSLNPTI